MGRHFCFGFGFSVETLPFPLGELAALETPAEPTAALRQALALHRTGVA